MEEMGAEEDGGRRRKGRKREEKEGKGRKRKEKERKGKKMVNTCTRKNDSCEREKMTRYGITLRRVSYSVIV